MSKQSNAVKPMTNAQTSFLSVATKALLTSAMDQYLRTLGPIKTHYAPNMQSALRLFSEGTVHILMCELDLGDASVFRLVQHLISKGLMEDIYFVLVVPERTDAYSALCTEIEAHELLLKPFNADYLRGLIERYDLWRTMPKEPWRLLVREAQNCVREKRFREAESNFLEAVQAAPDNPLPACKLGAYLLKKPDYVNAETYLKKALELQPHNTHTLSLLGSLYLTTSQLDKAEEHLCKAQLISPLNPDRLVEITHLYVDRCVSACRDSLKIDPGNHSARFILGKLLILEKDYVAAVRALEEVMPYLRDEQKKEAQVFLALARKLSGVAK